MEPDRNAEWRTWPGLSGVTCRELCVPGARPYFMGFSKTRHLFPADALSIPVCIKIARGPEAKVGVEKREPWIED